MKELPPARSWATKSAVSVVTAAFLIILFSPSSTSQSPNSLRRTAATEYPFVVRPDEKSSSVKECLLKNGLAYGPFRDGQAPSGPGALFPFPSTDQIDEDIRILRGVTSHIRTYASSGDYPQIAQLAKSQMPPLNVMQGIYLRWDSKKTKEQNDADNKEEIDTAVGLARKGLVDSVIVGNETFAHSGSGTQAATPVPKEALVHYIREVKKGLASTKVPVSTAQVFSDWEANLDIASDVDFVVAHFYPFWDKKPVAVEHAAAWVLTNYKKLKADLRAKYGRDVEVIIGETGWPSGGEARDDAVPSPENQRRFLKDFTAEACSNAIRFYYFSAFDEEWKWDEGGNQEWLRRHHRNRLGSELPADRTLSGNWIGSSWGIFESNGKLKPGLNDLFDEPAPGSRVNRDIFLSNIGRLSTYYDMGVESDPDHTHDWLQSTNGELTMSYPSRQHWGSVFITVGKPRPSSRPWKDFSEFKTLVIEMRGEWKEKVNKGERVKIEIGIKNRSDPDNGNETRIVKTLTEKYCVYRFPLTAFASNTHLNVPKDLAQLYTVVEFVFHGPKAHTVYVRNIRYEPK